MRLRPSGAKRLRRPSPLPSRTISGGRTSTRYSIVAGDPRAHKADVLALGARNLPGMTEWRYLKYYETNPHGPPLFFFAHDGESDRFVGIAALFPTTLRVRGQLVSAAVPGDFAVDADHRGFGPAVRLQRTLLSTLPRAGLGLAFGTPNKLSEPVIRRAGYTDLGRLTKFVKVLKTKAALERYVRRRVVTRSASAIADPVLSLISRERRYRRSRRFGVETPEAFDERFELVWEVGRRRSEVTSERSSRLLNWKFETARTDGSRRYSIFALLSAADEVVGYVVFFVRRNNVRHIVDFASLESDDVTDALLAEFILDARADGASAISLEHVGGPSLLTRRLRAFGFVPVQHGLTFFVYVPDESPFAREVLARENWYLLAGDIDI